jgi:hypothetical protein
MGNYASNTKLDQLTLVDGPDMAAPADLPPAPESALGGKLDLAPKTADPARAAGAAPPAARAPPPAAVAPGKPVPLRGRNLGESYDPFIAEAAQEFERGHVEQPLWVRSLAQANGKVDEAKPAYLRARAVALRLERRNKPAEPSPQRSGSTDRRAKAPVRRTFDGKRIGIGGLALGIAIVVFFVVRPDSAPPAPGTAVPKATPATAARADDAKRPRANSGPPPEDFAARIQSFKDAGNWNVLVLYAVEWTRKEPANAQAWKELGGGYLRMKQYEDALDATRKAVQMAPDDAQLWQNLGQINVALWQPAAALSAFEKASALNEHDVASRAQAGALNLELGHLPEARAAFASALAINPLDVEALCGSATVARKEGRTKDVEAFARSLKSAGLECREPEAPASPPVVAVPPPARKPATARR